MLNLNARLDQATNIITIVTCVAVMGLLVARYHKDNNPVVDQATMAVERMKPDNVELSIKESPTRGAPTAAFALVEFSDYQCPFCSRHAREVLPELQREFISQGTLMYVVRNFPLATHSFAVKAAEAAECAFRQGQFWPMHNQLLSNQNALGINELINHAAALGLNAAVFEKCLSDEATAKIEEDRLEARRLGIQATPSFIVGVLGSDGRLRVMAKINGAQPYTVFKTVLRDIGAAN